jgi:menaquinone-dependent protoporphyrinogen oxidase
MNAKTGISRRRFLVLGAGATALACGGMGALGMQPPAVELATSSCGVGNDPRERVLVAYASQCGSTGEIAAAIGQVLCEAGAAVDVHPVDHVSDLSPYRAVVVGSAVHSSKWLPEAMGFVERQREALNRVPVACFAASLTNVEDTAETRRRAASFLDPVREQVQPVDEGLFAGKLDFGKLPFLYRFLWPLTAGGHVGEGDYRDWEAIRAWATGLGLKLLGA